jgi:predicted metalloenzyme YecM
MAITRNNQKVEDFTEIVYDALQASCEKLMGVRSWVWMRVCHRIAEDLYRNAVNARVEIVVKTTDGVEFVCVRDECVEFRYPFNSDFTIPAGEMALRTALAGAVEDTKIRLLMLADLEERHWFPVHEHIKVADFEGKLRVGYGTIYIAQTWGARDRERERYDKYANP